MGMFDSFKDDWNIEYQTKAFGNSLHVYRAGDPIHFPLADFQVEALGPGGDTLVTIRDGKVYQIPDYRDKNLPLIDYYGGATGE